MMNADASRGVDMLASAGFRTGLLLPIGIGLAAAGAVALGVAAVLFVVSAGGSAGRPAARRLSRSRPDRRATTR